MKPTFLSRLQSGEHLSVREQIYFIVKLSFPAILAQISSIIMQYIDAAMVGRLGADSSAAIGLVSSATWLFGGVSSAAVVGFTIQAAQKIGAGEDKNARNIMKHAFIGAVGFAVLLAFAGALIAFPLPVFLGGDNSICHDAGIYFLIYALSIPACITTSLAGGMLQASGNMHVPGILNILMCLFDVVFNFFFIFGKNDYLGITLPGAGLGVAGASLGTAVSQVVTALLMLFFLLARSPHMGLRRKEKFKFTPSYFKIALRLAFPVALEQTIMCSAYVMATKIISPLGNVAIAAHSFAVTAESLCYMPGYGIGTAASTIIGQSIGAERRELTRKMGWIVTLFGTAIMTLSGIFMFFTAPAMMGILSSDPEVVKLGVEVLHIEAFAEPLYGASIVAAGVFRGAGDTMASGVMNLISMWAVRIPLSALLAPKIGLHGIWLAMCIELCVRGILYLIRLGGKAWSKKAIE